ncbi:hypothetical protein GUJ93_ZPchr0001g30883 [Zizania palustris]|uniref:Uncharacterized protein n=1 Tax=Zizania palustris TaxID=103762 RepID=A0A8J5S0Y4_ZIZPA|nr:hypothetical protein GUJ93_ZPchr0001g30883 [Zizania palustris]
MSIFQDGLRKPLELFHYLVMNEPTDPSDMITTAEQFANVEDVEQEQMHSNTQDSSENKKKKDRHQSHSCDDRENLNPPLSRGTRR